MDSSGLLHCVANDKKEVDCHDLQSKSRNDRMLDSSVLTRNDRPLSLSLRGSGSLLEAQNLQRK